MQITGSTYILGLALSLSTIAGAAPAKSDLFVPQGERSVAARSETGSGSGLREITKSVTTPEWPYSSDSAMYKRNVSCPPGINPVKIRLNGADKDAYYYVEVCADGSKYYTGNDLSISTIYIPSIAKYDCSFIGLHQNEGAASPALACISPLSCEVQAFGPPQPVVAVYCKPRYH